ncbi:MAG: glycosyltransferase [Solirubrobacteraceae bacterium]|nr:glycosyltransferase [Solirubrobacteraceae bacterium]
MALRLSAEPTAPTPGDGDPIPDPAPTAEPAVPSLEAWRTAWRAAEADADPQRRHRARLRLTGELLAVDDGDVRALAVRLVTLAGALIAALEDEPREPLLLNHAGVALYELGALRTADALFAGAERLDPTLPWLERNRAEIRRRRRAAGGRPPLPPAVARELRALEPRARRVAGRARPAEGLTMSLCMIVRDEEAMLGRCLAAVRDGVDEIVIVDTGSTDRTVEIAESYGARVLHFTWCDDFSAARNVSFDAATGDWLLYLDADEVLHDGHAARLRALTGRTWREAMYLSGMSHTGDEGDGTAMAHESLRLFRNRPGRRFAGRLHEQIQGLTELSDDRFEVADVRFEHFGYLGEVRAAKDKRSRNRELIEQQLAEGDDGPFVRFNLGMEHCADGDHVGALPHLRRAWAGVRDDPAKSTLGFVPLLALHLVDSLRLTGAPDEALELADDVLARYPAFTDVVLLQGQIARVRGDLDVAEERFETCLRMGDAPGGYGATAGAGSYLATRALAGVRSDRGEHDEAVAMLERSLATHPQHLRTVESLARALRAAGVDGATTRDRVLALVPDRSPNARYLLGMVLHQTGATAEAEETLRGVLADRGGSDVTRVTLAECLLYQGRLEEAAEVAAGVAPSSEHEPAGVRHAAFATIASGADPAAILDRAAGVLPADEHALLAAWTGRDVRLDPRAEDVALTMLNALLRLERFAAFEALAAAFERIGLPWRERRERLAALYLRRGFLASAAEEWMRVVDRDGPDARALRGLALVAAEHGLDEDAARFAADAEALAGCALEEIR